MARKIELKQIVPYKPKLLANQEIGVYVYGAAQHSVDAKPNTIVLRDALGNIKINQPVDNNDATNKEYVDQSIQDVLGRMFRFRGNIYSAEITAELLYDDNVNSFYNLLDDYVTQGNLFVEGNGIRIEKGSSIVVVAAETGYKFDVLGSPYALNLENGEGVHSVKLSGSNNMNYGESAVVFGENNTNSSPASLVVGRHNKNIREGAIVGGTYNIAGASGMLEIGNGNSYVRSNAFEVRNTGSAIVGGVRYDDLGAADATPSIMNGRQSFSAGGGIQVYGDWNAGFNKETKAYQRGVAVFGGGSQAGMTEEEFNNYYWDSTNKIALHEGKGKDANGNILDFDGRTYATAYSFAFATGEQTKALGRGGFTSGSSNVQRGRHGAILGGEANITNSNYSAIIAGRDNYVRGGIQNIIAGGSNNVLEETAISSVILGGSRHSILFNDTVIAGGTGHKSSSSRTFIGGGIGNIIQANLEDAAVFGRYNDSTSNALFQIGNGTADADRKNAFEVFRDGRAKVQTAPRDDKDVVRLLELQTAHQTVDVITSQDDGFDVLYASGAEVTLPIKAHDGIVVDVDENNEFIDIHLEDTFLNNINRAAKALITPVTSPTEFELVGIDTANSQARVKLGNGLSYNSSTKVLSASGGGTADVSNLVTLDGDQTITGQKTFDNDAYFYGIASFGAVSINLGGVNPTDGTIDIGLPDNKHSRLNINDLMLTREGFIDSGFGPELMLPRDPDNQNALKSGTIATTNDVKKYYRHNIRIAKNDPEATAHVNLSVISSKATVLTFDELVQSLIGMQGWIYIPAVYNDMGDFSPAYILACDLNGEEGAGDLFNLQVNVLNKTIGDEFFTWDIYDSNLADYVFEMQEPIEL